MTQRLPTPGGDDNDWGTILNGFLGVSLNSDGTLNTSATVSALGSAATSVSFNGQKLTNIANGSASTDAVAFGQIPTALPPNGSAGGDLTGSYPNPTLSGTSNVESVITANTTVAGALQKTNNLSDVSSAGTSRYNIHAPVLAPAVAAATGNISISSAPGTIDGVTPSSGDIVLLPLQSTSSQNGVWTYNGSGSALTRPTEFPSGGSVKGRTVAVTGGTQFPNTTWILDAGPGASITIDTTAQVWSVSGFVPEHYLFTSSTTKTLPQGVYSMNIIAGGAAGGGAASGATSTFSGGGGAAGNNVQMIVTTDGVGVLTFLIGAGGIGVAGAAGNAGGSTNVYTSSGTNFLPYPGYWAPAGGGGAACNSTTAGYGGMPTGGTLGTTIRPNSVDFLGGGGFLGQPAIYPGVAAAETEIGGCVGGGAGGKAALSLGGSGGGAGTVIGGGGPGYAAFALTSTAAGATTLTFANILGIVENLYLGNMYVTGSGITAPVTVSNGTFTSYPAGTVTLVAGSGGSIGTLLSSSSYTFAASQTGVGATGQSAGTQLGCGGGGAGGSASGATAVAGGNGASGWVEVWRVA